MPGQEPKISDATKAADRHDAELKGDSDRMPTPEEEAAAEQNRLDPNAARAYKEAAERGANQRGEGRIEG
jgi:hypothetical protein